MKKIQKGATKRLAYGGIVIIFVLAMAALAATSFYSKDSQPAQTKSFAEKVVTTDDRGEVITDDRTTNTTTNPGTVCDPHYTICGRIKIVQNTVPDSSQDFYFYNNIPGYVTPLALDDDATMINPPPSVTNNTKTFYTPANGNYYVAEPAVTGYTTSLSCSDPSSGTTISGGTANVSISGGETVTCTFNNLWTGSTQACVPNTWIQKADFGGGGREYAIAFSSPQNGKGYLGMGIPTNAGNMQDLWEYNPMINVWESKASLPIFNSRREDGVAFAIGLKAYVGTGMSYVGNELVSLGDLWEYDISSNTWTQKADLPGNTRTSAVGFSIGSRGYVGTGSSLEPNTSLHDFWEYNPSNNTWIQKADFGGGNRQYAVGFSIGSRGYVGTGFLPGTEFMNDFWEYNPSSDIWTQKAVLPGVPRVNAVGFSIGGMGYIGTGNSEYVKLKDFWQYNPSSNTWTQKANVGGYGRYRAAGFSVGGRGYIGTGRTSGFTDDLFEYCP